MKENPYRLAEDISGIGFRIADEIATNIGLHTDSDFRIRSGILYALLQAVSEGHCYLPLQELLNRSKELLQVDICYIEPHIDNLMMDKKLIRKNEAIYATSYYYAELACARMLTECNSKASVEGR